MQEATLILCAVAGIITAALIRRSKANAETETSILESSIEKLKSDSNYTTERDVLLSVYSSKLKNLKSNSIKKLQTTQIVEQKDQIKEADSIEQRADTVSSMKQDIEPDIVNTTPASVSKPVVVVKPSTAAQELLPKDVKSDATSVSKPVVVVKPSTAAQELLPKDVKSDATSVSKPVVVVKPSTAAQELLPKDVKSDATNLELKDKSKIDVAFQTNSKVKSDAKTINKIPNESEVVVEPPKSSESMIDSDDGMGEEELEKIKKNVKEALAKLERAESE